MSFYFWQCRGDKEKDLILSVHVLPRSSQAGIKGVYGDRLKIKITAAPVDGQANTEVCKLLSKQFGVAKSQIIIQSGQTSRKKCICIKSPKKLPEFISYQ